MAPEWIWGIVVKRQPIKYGWNPLVTLSRETIERMGLKSIIWEVIIADTPNILCRCYIDGELLCPPMGCGPGLLKAVGCIAYNGQSWCHLYDDTKRMYGFQCVVEKDIWHAKHKVELGVWCNDQQANILAGYIRFKRWIKLIHRL